MRTDCGFKKKLSRLADSKITVDRIVHQIINFQLALDCMLVFLLTNFAQPLVSLVDSIIKMMTQNYTMHQ